MDPFYLHHVVTANAEIATAMENLSSDDPHYDEKHGSLVKVSNMLEAIIMCEVAR